MHGVVVDDTFKKKVRHWLKHHIGEPVGPEGKHLPIPNLVAIDRPACAECPDDAVNYLRGWMQNGDRVDIPLCRAHSRQARNFLTTRREELVSRDRTNKLRRSEAGD